MTSSLLQLHAYPTRRNNDLLAVGESSEQIAEWLADHLLLLGEACLKKNDHWTLAIPGGRTPKLLFEQLAKQGNNPLWTRNHLFWTDERCVPPNDSLSNYKMAMDHGLQKIDIPEEQIHRILGEEPPALAAQAYEKELINICGVKGSLDAVVLGMGNDGHIASLFPNSSALNEKKQLVAANYISSQSMWRITLSFLALHRAKNLFILVTGREKSKTLEVLFQEGERCVYPIQQLAAPDQQLIWCLDQAAAESIAL